MISETLMPTENIYAYISGICNGETQYYHYTPAGGGLAQLIKSGQMISDDREFFRDRRRNGILRVICGQLAMDIEENFSSPVPALPPMVGKAMHYIQLNFQYPINCGGVSDALGVNRTMLSGEFHRSVSSTMKELILDSRLNKAKWLLEESAFKVKEVAEQCGFSDPGYFIRIFQKHSGVLRQITERVNYRQKGE